MISIWKFKLEPAETQEVTMPFGAVVLSAQCQGDDICLWVQLDTTNASSPERRIIEVFGTGEAIPYEGERKFIGTVLDGALVWHVFERIS